MAQDFTLFSQQANLLLGDEKLNNIHEFIESASKAPAFEDSAWVAGVATGLFFSGTAFCAPLLTCSEF